ncbi:MAG: hypothetical protein AB8E15_10505 [Bdellovibrionales bacterium]
MRAKFSAKDRASALTSLFIIVVSLLTVVFCKMEIRRMGYLIWKESRATRLAQDKMRLQSLKFAKLTRPDRIEIYAKRYFELKKARPDQIISLNSK